MMQSQLFILYSYVRTTRGRYLPCIILGIQISWKLCAQGTAQRHVVSGTISKLAGTNIYHKKLANTAYAVFVVGLSLPLVVAFFSSLKVHCYVWSFCCARSPLEYITAPNPLIIIHDPTLTLEYLITVSLALYSSKSTFPTRWGLRTADCGLARPP